MTVYELKDFNKEARIALKDLRKKAPDANITLNNPAWFVCVDKETICLAVRLKSDANGVKTEFHYNVAI